jgi:predicted PurR-regulated permease PerM
MAGQPTPYTFDRVVRMVLSAAALIGIFLLLRYLSDVLIPFAIAIVLAYLLNPLVNLFQRLIPARRDRGLAVFLTLFGLGIVGSALVILIVPLMVSQVDRFRGDIYKLFDDSADAPVAPPTTLSTEEPKAPSSIGWQELTEGWSEYRRDAGEQTSRERFRELRLKLAGTYIGSALEEIIRYFKSGEARAMLFSLAQQLAAGGWTVVLFAVNLVLGITGLVLVLVYLIFLLIDYPEFSRAWPGFLPPQYRDQTVDFFAQFDAALRQYLRGQSVVALLTGTMYATGFTLIGLPMAVPFGLFIGLLNMVPYLAAVSIVPGLLLAVLRAIEGEAGIASSIGLLFCVYAVIQVLQDTVITPRVMGQATGLRPIAILLGVFIWGKLLGFLGLILAIPLTCLGIAYYRRYILQNEALPAASVAGAAPT